MKIALNTSISIPDFSISTVNVAQRNPPTVKRFQRPFSPHPARGRGRGRGRTSYSPFQYSPSPNRPICQICNRVGHTASKCFNRFDHSYHSDTPTPASFLTTQSSPPDFNWYPDTGSTNHLTNDLSNLNLKADEYHGTDQIRVGNGQGLQILYTGFAHLPTPHINFSLPHLLHVPHIKKKLIYVHLFTHDNQVFHYKK